jgi:hypothetical protein
VGEVHAAFLEHAAVVDYTADATAAFRAIPGIGFEATLAISGRQALADTFLKTKQILFNCFDVGF